MPHIVSCPQCATKLKSAQPIPAGRAVRCTKCQHIFTLTEATPAEPVPAAPPPPPQPGPTPPPLRPRPAAPQHIPAAVLLDDDLDADRPRTGPRRSRDDDDRDDRPPVLRHRDEDPEYDPPSRRPARPRRKRNPALLVLIGAGIGLVLLLLVGGALLLIVDPFHWLSGAPSEMLAWAPSDTGAVTYMDLDELRKYEKVRNTAPPATTRLGLAPDDVSAALTCGRQFGGLDGEVTVLKLRSAPNQDQIVRTVGGTAATASGKSYYATRDGGAVHFPGGRLVVVTRSPATMNALLQKPAGQVVVSDELRAAINRADGQFWMASLLPGGMLGPGFPAFPAGGQPRSFLMCITLSGNTAEVRTEATFPDAAAARQAAAGAESVRPQVVGKRNWTYSVTTSGNTIIITSSGPIDEGKAFGFPF